MGEYLVQFLVGIIPALITGVLAYLTASKKAKSEMKTVELQANKELEKLKEDNKVKFEDLEKQRQHDLEKLKEERKNDLIYYQGQLEAQAKYDETTKFNNLTYDFTGKVFNDVYEKSQGDIDKFIKDMEKFEGNTQASKAKQFARNKKKKIKKGTVSNMLYCPQYKN